MSIPNKPINIQEFKNVFKDIPFLILNKKEIVFINSKAKKILCITNKNKEEIHSLLYNNVNKKKHETKITCNNKEIKLIYQKNKDHYLVFIEDLTKQKEQEKNIKTQLKLFNDIFENLPVGILLHDYGKLKYVNKEGKRIIGTSDKKKYYNFNLLNFLYIDKEKQKAINRIKKVYIEKKLPSTIYHIRDFKNKEKIVELTSLLFFDEKNQPLSLLIVQDKTEELKKQQLEIETQLKIQENKLLKKQNEEKEKLLQELKSTHNQLINTINYSDYLFWITDNKLNIQLFNQAFKDYCLRYYNVKLKGGENTLDLQKIMNEQEPSTATTRQRVLKEILQTKSDYSYEISHFDKTLKKTRIYKITFKPYIDESNTLQNFYCFGHEITEKYEFLQQIESQALKLNTIIQHSPIYLWSLNQNYELVLFNNKYENLIEFLYGEKPVVGKKLTRGKFEKNKDLIETLNYHYEKAFNGSNENFKLNYELENGQKITLDVNLFPIVVNNQIKEIAGIATDITAEIEKQNQLQTLLYENEVLMKEIHHRIKNNLQVISSMLNLQIQNEENTQIQNVLKDTQNRVYSMAIIHQTLYQNKNYSTINVSATILFLIQNILYSFNRTDIEIESDIEEIILDVNMAIPIALIINEAITNVLKYAFPENFTMSKKVFIQLKRKDFSIELSIKDNGIGIDKKMIQQLSNVGFSIIKALAEQINAQLFIYSEKNQGTEIKLLIPLL